MYAQSVKTGNAQELVLYGAKSDGAAQVDFCVTSGCFQAAFRTFRPARQPHLTARSIQRLFQSLFVLHYRALL